MERDTTSLGVAILRHLSHFVSKLQFVEWARCAWNICGRAAHDRSQVQMASFGPWGYPHPDVSPVQC